MSDRNPSAGTVLGAFLLGGAVGAAIALLTAPKSGRETRADMSEWAQGAADRTRERVSTWAQDTGERVRGLASQTSERARGAATNARERIKHAADEAGDRLKSFGTSEEQEPPETEQT
jgi:gas vesicle protein